MHSRANAAHERDPMDVDQRVCVLLFHLVCVALAARGGHSTRVCAVPPPPVDPAHPPHRMQIRSSGWWIWPGHVCHFLFTGTD